METVEAASKQNRLTPIIRRPLSESLPLGPQTQAAVVLVRPQFLAGS